MTIRVIAILSVFASVAVGIPRYEPSHPSASGRPSRVQLDTARLARTIGTLQGDDRYLFGSIAYTQAGKADRLHVLDALFFRVQAYDSAGRHIRSVGREGPGPGEFSGPYSLAVLASGELVVRDVTVERYVVFRDGRSPLHIPAGVGSGLVRTHLATDTLGHFYDSRISYRDPSRRSVVVRFALDAPSRPPDTLGLPNHQRPMLSVEGANPSYRGDFFQPLSAGMYWTVLPSGHLVTAVGNEYVLRVHDPAGDPVEEISGDRRRVPVPSDVRSMLRDSMVAVIRRSARLAEADWRSLAEEIILPEHYPAVLGLWSDRSGRLWVKIPSADAPSTHEFDVWEGTGRYVGTVVVVDEPRLDSRSLSFGRRFIYGKTRLENDVQVVRQFRLPDHLAQP